MNNSDEDFSYSIRSKDRSRKILEFESSLDSYSTFFNREINNFTTSSEFEDNPLSTETFIKETSTTIINAFTGKPISPNPWAKLCTKPIPHHLEQDLIPIQNFSPNSTKVTPQRQSNNKKSTRSSRRDDINDQAFEQYNSIQIQQQNTPLQRRRKKRNSLKDTIDDSSTSSDERNKEQPLELHPKINRLIDNDSSWYRLADIYTSDESDENNPIQHSNTSHSIQLKPEVYTTASKENPPRVFNFLESLSNRISFEDKHPDAKSYFLPSGFNLKQKRKELADQLLSIFNEDVFSSQLSDKVSVVWSGRLTATAGHCTSRRNTRTAVITLSNKVCDSPERCRDTLLHEMCHAAVTLIDGVMEQGHGTLWRKWTRIAEQCYPYLPTISVRHTYDVVYKFIYRCVQCEYEVYRHSKSLDIAVDYCGKCLGQFVLIINDDKDGGIEQDRTTPKKTINKYNLFVKQNFQLIKQDNPHLSTPQVMKELSEMYKKKNQQQQQHMDLPDLEQLKI